MEILIKRLSENAKLPVYESEAGPGIDLYVNEDVAIEPNTKKVVSTGIVMAMPVGYIGLICGYNSMDVNDPLKVTMVVIDSGYREEIKIELTNTGSEQRAFAVGEKIAQVLVQQVNRANLIEAEDLGGE
jgi:dUTP pyrophosphatase